MECDYLHLCALNEETYFHSLLPNLYTVLPTHLTHFFSVICFNPCFKSSTWSRHSGTYIEVQGDRICIFISIFNWNCITLCLENPFLTLKIVSRYESNYFCCTKVSPKDDIFLKWLWFQTFNFFDRVWFVYQKCKARPNHNLGLVG